MKTEKPTGSDAQTLKHYRAVEARLYGDVMKVCRSYGSHLSLISILGILDIVKDELKDLDQRGRRLMRQESPETESENLETIV